MKTGDIWLAQLDPTMGSEIQKTRLCVVISPNVRIPRATGQRFHDNLDTH